MSGIGTYPTQNVTAQTPLLAYAEVASGIPTTTSGTDVDITGLSVTVTVQAGRRIKVSAFAGVGSSVVGDAVRVAIKEGANYICDGGATIGAGIEEVNPNAIISPTAGTHTYKVAWRRQSGTGTLTMYGAGTIVAYIMVEDITGSQLPVLPQSVPVGVLSQAFVTAAQTGITTEIAVTGLTANVTVPAGRVLRVEARVGAQRTVADGLNRLRIKMDGSDVSLSDMPVRGALEGSIEHRSEVILSPSAGAHTFTVTYRMVTGSGTVTADASASNPAYLIVEDITPTPAPGQGAPGSTLAYAEVVATQGTLGTGADLTGLTATVTVPAGRRIRIVVSGQFSNSVNDAHHRLDIKEGATILQTRHQSKASTTQYEDITTTAIITPSAGTHTYKASYVASSGSGSMFAASDQPAFILVEDITGAVWPAGSTVTVGMVASEAWTVWTPTLTAITLGSGSVVARYQRMGRTIDWKFMFTFGAGSAIASGPSFTLPVAPSADYVAWGSPLGVAIANDGGFAYDCGVEYIGSSTVRIQVFAASGSYTAAAAISSTVPFTWASGDTLSASGSYEAAS